MAAAAAAGLIVPARLSVPPAVIVAAAAAGEGITPVREVLALRRCGPPRLALDGATGMPMMPVPAGDATAVPVVVAAVVVSTTAAVAADVVVAVVAAAAIVAWPWLPPVATAVAAPCRGEGPENTDSRSGAPVPSGIAVRNWMAERRRDDRRPRAPRSDGIVVVVVVVGGGGRVRG